MNLNKIIKGFDVKISWHMARKPVQIKVNGARITLDIKTDVLDRGYNWGTTEFVDLANLLINLHKPGLRMFCYIIKRLPLDSNVIKIDVEDCMRELSIPLRVYQSSIKELKDNGFLKPAGKDYTYILNHNIAYRGDVYQLYETLNKEE